MHFNEIGSGCGLSHVEKVFVGAMALETRDIGAISDLTAVPGDTVGIILQVLDETAWDVAATLERLQNDIAHNAVYNAEAYSILWRPPLAA